MRLPAKSRTAVNIRAVRLVIDPANESDPARSFTGSVFSIPMKDRAAVKLFGKDFKRFPMKERIAVSVRLVRLLMLPENEMVAAKAMSLRTLATNVPMNDRMAVRFRRVDLSSAPVNESMPVRSFTGDRK